MKVSRSVSAVQIYEFEAVGSGLVQVTSPKGKSYEVWPDARSCSCPDAQIRRHHCKHLEAVLGHFAFLEWFFRVYKPNAQNKPLPRQRFGVVLSFVKPHQAAQLA